tara:strand:+ start:2313 stop:2603 length:291 start_codon:yes stop_codon:yes gene_type:complete
MTTDEDKQLDKDIINNVTVNATEVINRLSEIKKVLKEDLQTNQKLFNDAIHSDKFDRDVGAIYIKTIHNLIDTIKMLGEIKIRPEQTKSGQNPKNK